MNEVMSLRERLAALEHEQRAHWTRHLLDHLTPENIECWRRQIDTPYDQLSESEKQCDREWSDRLLELVASPGLRLRGKNEPTEAGSKRGGASDRADGPGVRMLSHVRSEPP